MAITMTMLKTTETTSGGEEKKRQLVFFNSLSEQFDPEKCTSDQKFTVNPNNEYVVMTRLMLLDGLAESSIWLNPEDCPLRQQSILWFKGPVRALRTTSMR